MVLGQLSNLSAKDKVELCTLHHSQEKTPNRFRYLNVIYETIEFYRKTEGISL